MSRAQGKVIRERDGLRLEQHAGGEGYLDAYDVLYSPEGKWENPIFDGVYAFHSGHSRSHAYAAFAACHDMLRTMIKEGIGPERACTTSKACQCKKCGAQFIKPCLLEALLKAYAHCPGCGARTVGEEDTADG